MPTASITSFFKPIHPVSVNHVAKPFPPVPGLTLHHNFVTPQQESAILAFLDTQKWRTDLKRRCIHYGGTYCLLPPPGSPPTDQQEIITALPIPPELYFLLDLFKERGIYTQKAPQYCIVNEYVLDQGISAHVENFRFGEPVCGLTLNDRGSMRFHELTTPHDGSVRTGKSRLGERTGRRVDVWMERRSLVVMQGDARHKWQHEISRSETGRPERWRRVSLTFRVDLNE